MSMGKEKIIPILAMTVLVIGSFSALFVHANQLIVEKDTIVVNGEKFTTKELFESVNLRTIQTDEGNKTGLALDELIIYSGVNCPLCHKYTIKAKDPYQKTVNWDDMKKGVFTDYERVYFKDKAHAYWVYDVVEIEVI